MRERTYFDSGEWHQIDSRTPLDDLMQAEDGELGEEITVDSITGIPRDALRRLVLFLIPAKAISARKKWRLAQIRLALVSHLLDVDGVGGQTFESLAQELGCTRALLSHYSLQMVDSLGINKAPSGKARASREVYRQSAIEAHRRAGHRMRETSQEAS